MIEFESQGERWQVDDEFLSSNWTCIWGRGCLGIGDTADPSHLLGCCSLGAEFADEADAANVAALAACLPDELWQHSTTARDHGIFADEGRGATRVVDGACIFLNRAGFAGGAGCALHLGAVADDEPPHRWKPAVCWELPVRLDISEQDGIVVNIVRRWERSDFGSDGDDMAWFCTDTPHAYVGEDTVLSTLAPQLRDMLGEQVFVEVAARVVIAADQRRPRD